MRMIKIDGDYVNYITEEEAISFILNEKGRFVSYLGAGASAEAGVPTAISICNQIKERKTRGRSPEYLERWENEVNWKDYGLRYFSCMKTYGPQAMRVQFFRELLKGKNPSFVHHAVALLMANNVFASTCLTTNFDKLLETAFAQHGKVECQPIRTDEEAIYWENSTDRWHVIKLHGDYDTHNILNTESETVNISKVLREKVDVLLKSAGMVVLGAASHEKSTYSMFDQLSNQVGTSSRILDFGLFWGVYMGPAKPKSLGDKELDDLMKERITAGINQDIIKMMSRVVKAKNDHFCFFPVWGAGDFLFNLVKEMRSLREYEGLSAEAKLYLDHNMRVRHVLQGAGLPEVAIDQHLERLRTQKEKLEGKLVHLGLHKQQKSIFSAKNEKTLLNLEVVYGDITNPTIMEANRFADLRRAIVSPEDTCLSAGGGVALRLLNGAGSYVILNELSKFSKIEQGTIAVTSGGRLPVHYIFHAASIKIKEDGSYDVSLESIHCTMQSILEKALALEIRLLLVPLMGAGLASLGPKRLGSVRSFEAILEAIAGWGKTYEMTIQVVIYDELDPEPTEIHRCLQEKLSSQFLIEKLY